MCSALSGVTLCSKCELLPFRHGKVLLEIHKIMLEDACTKEMFRVMDGFLVLMSVLSTIQPAHSWPVAVSGDQIVMDVLEATRLVFAILSESLYKDEENVRFFEVNTFTSHILSVPFAKYISCQQSVGYESLAQAISPLLSDPKTVNETLGFLVALSLHDFSLSNLFEITDFTNYESIDRRLQDLSPRFVTIRHPGAIRALYTSIPSLAPRDDGRTASLRRYYVYRLLERLSAHNHRNYAILNSLHLVGPLFEAYHAGTSIPESEDGAGMPKPERQVILKLLRRLLELGSTSEEARLMFRTALKKDETLNGDVLEVLRAGMKTRWPEHFSLVGPSALVVPCEPSKGLPSSGFTFMVCTILFCLTVNSDIRAYFSYGYGWRIYQSLDPIRSSLSDLRRTWCFHCVYEQTVRWNVSARRTKNLCYSIRRYQSSVGHISC